MLKEKLTRALKSKAVLTERSKQLKSQVEDLTRREEQMNDFASELMDRQRELNYMLHRANSVLHQLQDTNLALSSEFTQLVRELPPPKDAGWDERITKVNELFKRTHELADEIQDEVFSKAKGTRRPRVTAEPVSPAQEAGPAPPPPPEVVVEASVQPVVEEPPESEHVPRGGPVEVEAASEGPVEAQIAETPTEEAPASVVESLDRDARVEELFRRQEEIKLDESKWSADGRAVKEKRGFWARLFRRGKKSSGAPPGT
jgi:hypothetical protein